MAAEVVVPTTSTEPSNERCRELAVVFLIALISKTYFGSRLRGDVTDFFKGVRRAMTKVENVNGTHIYLKLFSVCLSDGVMLFLVPATQTQSGR